MISALSGEIPLQNHHHLMKGTQPAVNGRSKLLWKCAKLWPQSPRWSLPFHMTAYSPAKIPPFWKWKCLVSSMIRIYSSTLGWVRGYPDTRKLIEYSPFRCQEALISIMPTCTVDRHCRPSRPKSGYSWGKGGGRKRARRCIRRCAVQAQNYIPEY